MVCARGDELPEQLRTPEGRREFFRRPGSSLLGRARSWPRRPRFRRGADREFEFDPERILARVQGRKGWLRDAERQLEQHRWEIPIRLRARAPERLLLAAERLEGDLAAERAGNEAFEHIARRPGRAGRRLAGTPKPYSRPRCRRER